MEDGCDKAMGRETCMNWKSLIGVRGGKGDERKVVDGVGDGSC